MTGTARGDALAATTESCSTAWRMSRGSRVLLISTARTAVSPVGDAISASRSARWRPDSASARRAWSDQPNGMRSARNRSTWRSTCTPVGGCLSATGMGSDINDCVPDILLFRLAGNKQFPVTRVKSRLPTPRRADRTSSEGPPKNTPDTKTSCRRRLSSRPYDLDCRNDVRRTHSGAACGLTCACDDLVEILHGRPLP